MKNNVRLLVGMIIIILGIIMTIIAFAMSTVVNKDTIVEKEKQSIVDSYTELTVVAGTNIDLRNEISEKIDAYTNENYPQEHETYIDLLNKYEENYKTVASHIEEIDKQCKNDYEDSRIDIMCKSYKMLYEEITNIYVSNLTKYNNNIKNYNQTLGTTYEEFTMIQTEYIDYDKDGNYLGKPTE